MTFIQARHFTRGRISPVRLLVVHDMEAAERLDTAEAIARYFRDLPPTKKASAHWCIDADSIVGCVRLEDTAYHAPGANADGIGYEFAGYARQTRDEWLDPYGRAMLALGAGRMRADAERYGIPIRLLSDAELRGGAAKGIVTHAQVSRVFKKSSHWDPGPHFPMDHLLGLLSGGVPAAPTPSLPPLAVPAYPGYALRATRLNDGAARTWQRQMRTRGWQITVDGDYGPRSAAVCSAFQREKGLAADGVVGPKTWAASWLAPVTS